MISLNSPSLLIGDGAVLFLIAVMGLIRYLSYELRGKLPTINVGFFRGALLTPKICVYMLIKPLYNTHKIVIDIKRRK